MWATPWMGRCAESRTSSFWMRSAAPEVPHREGPARKHNAKCAPPGGWRRGSGGRDRGRNCGKSLKLGLGWRWKSAHKGNEARRWIGDRLACTPSQNNLDSTTWGRHCCNVHPGRLWTPTSGGHTPSGGGQEKTIGEKMLNPHFILIFLKRSVFLPETKACFKKKWVGSESSLVCDTPCRKKNAKICSVAT